MQEFSVPLFKKNKRSEVGNYRPVSVLSVESKKIGKGCLYTIGRILGKEKTSVRFCLVLGVTFQLANV